MEEARRLDLPPNAQVKLDDRALTFAGEGPSMESLAALPAVDQAEHVDGQEGQPIGRSPSGWRLAPSPSKVRREGRLVTDDDGMVDPAVAKAVPGKRNAKEAASIGIDAASVGLTTVTLDRSGGNGGPTPDGITNS